MQQQPNLTDVFERITDAFVALDKNWCYTYMNKKAGEIFNRDPAMMIGKHIWTEFPEDKEQAFYKAYYKAMEEQRYVHLEEYYPSYDRWFENHIYPSPDGLSVFFKDITERKKAAGLLNQNQAFIESEERFRTLVEQASVSIFVYDKQGKFIEVNPSGEKLVGYTKEELSKLTVYDIVDPLTFNQVPFHFEELLRGEPIITERKYVKKDGTVIDVEVSSKLLSNGYFQGIANDITERKKTNQQLQNSNSRFEMIARATNDALWEWNLVTGELWANETHQQLYGLTMAHPVPGVDMWKECIHPEDRDKIVDMQSTSLSSEKNIFISEYRFRVVNGEYRNIYDRCYIIRDADGQPLTMVGSMMDVTEQKKIEKSLAERERHLYTILQTEPECIKQIGSNGELIDMNPAGLAMIEADNVEMVKGQSVLSIIAPDHRDAFVKLTKSIFEGKSGKLSFELIGLKGTHRWMETHAVPLKNTEGKIISLLSVTRDITENKKIQEQIIREKDLSDSIINSLPGVFYLYDENRKFLRWNKNFETVSGYSGAEIAIMHPLDFFPPEEKELLTNRISKVFEKGMSEVEAHFLTKNGEKIPYFFNGRTGKFDNKTCLIGMGIDITVQKNAEEQKEFERRDKEALINSTHDLIWSVNNDLKLIAANKAFINSLIVSTGTVFKPGDDMLREDIFPDDLLSFWKGLYEQALAGEFFTKEIFAPATNTRTAFWLEISFSPVYNEKDITGLACYARDITERKKTDEEIKMANNQLRELALHLQNIREEERKRIGREIHDDLGQQLTAIKMDVAWIDKKIPGESTIIKSKINNIISLLDGSHISVRRILNELRTDVLENYGLIDALEWQGRQFTANTNIPLSFNCTETELKVDDAIATCIFRVFQEALTNITRYANAQQVIASLNRTGTNILFTIEDDGQGFDTAVLKNNKSFGILGMKERVASLKGKFELLSSLGKGTKISISLPNRIKKVKSKNVL